ncbi:MAG: hypothetical protein ACRC8Y_02165 [Chroococcales cyanobacterium]
MVGHLWLVLGPWSFVVGPWSLVIWGGSWDGVHVCSNDFSRCSPVMADAMTG